ncbi:tetratricopeptide repeat protein [Rubritalea tangerina]|uniref:Tetratricopeptide repeat protein n=1 Tax=Rubritalea tangerina TaxID=430798 RepID=A0ABW4ZBM3_9BACT
MMNPYQSPRMEHFRHRIPPLYYLLSPFLLPKWLLWRFDVWCEEHAVGIRIREFFYKLTLPIRSVWSFLQAWAESRSYKKLLIASPVLIGAFVGFTVYFINANKNRGQAFDGYYESALEAMGQGDYKQADFLFAKLIHHPSYQDNDQVTFRAMLAANANGNVTRAKALRDKLLDEREYEPAKRWVAENAIKRGQLTQQEADALLAMARAMVEEHPDASYAGYWKMTLARLLLSVKKPLDAVEVLKGEEKLEPEAWLLLAQAYQAAGDSEMSKRELREMVDYLGRFDPQNDRYIREKVEGLATLAGLSLDQEESRQLMEEAVGIIEGKRQLAIDRSTYDAWLSEIRLRLFRLLLQMNEPELRVEAFQHLEKVIQAREPNYRVGEALNGVIDTSSGYSLLTGQIMEVVVRSGGSAAHLAMALDAWVGGNRSKTEFHLKLARAIHPNATVAARYAATSAARSSDPNQLDLNLFRGDNRSTYQRSLDLLGLILVVDPEQSINVAFDRCYIYSLRQSWSEVINLLEPNIAQFKGQDLVQAYEWLMRANSQLGEEDNAEVYQRAMLGAMQKLKDK